MGCSSGFGWCGQDGRLCQGCCDEHAAVADAQSSIVKEKVKQRLGLDHRSIFDRARHLLIALPGLSGFSLRAGWAQVENRPRRLCLYLTLNFAECSGGPSQLDLTACDTDDACAAERIETQLKELTASLNARADLLSQIGGDS